MYLPLPQLVQPRHRVLPDSTTLRCPSEVPNCCQGGWKITLAGSQFLSSEEQRYTAIEGEALAVVWALEQTKYFTQGCDNLIVVTDHKLLLKISGDRTLDEISNSGFFRLKQRTLPWHFDIVHRHRKCNQTTDATSRHPSPSGSVKDFTLRTPSNSNMAELALMATICSHAEKATIIHWSLIADATARDKSLSHILTLLETQGNIDSSDPALAGLCLSINLFTRRCTDVQRPCCGTRIPLP